MLITFIILYLFGTVAIGWWASRRVKTAKDFALAGRNLPLIVAASALFATWFGSETIMGASSEFIENGVIGIIEDPFGAALCLVLVGLFFARPLYRLNIITFNDFFRIRFNRRTELISAIFMVPSYFGWIAAQLVAMAILLNAIANIPLFWGIMICTLVVVAYTYIGGMWAVSVTDFVQTIMILLGLIILAAQLFAEVGSFDRLIEGVPEGFFRFTPEPDLHHIAHYIAAWITIGLGSIPQQDIFQRVMAAKSANTAVKASYLGGVGYLVIGLIPLFIGLCGKVLYPEIHTGDPQMVLPQMVLQHSNLFLQILFFGALLSAILSTTSGAILAPATVIGENLIRPYLKEATDKKILQMMRWSVVGVAICSAIMANWNSNIFDLVSQSSALSLVSLFIPLTAGLYWKKASCTGALAAIFAGMGIWVVCEIIGTEIPSLIYGGLASWAGMLIGSWLIPDQSYVGFTSSLRSTSAK
ncbi:MAG: sodium:solute symporter family protein [Saprospiraceae bacterium]|nr:sodium:solute symporter family protein [Saprospiraceae bacterium]